VAGRSDEVGDRADPRRSDPCEATAIQTQTPPSLGRPTDAERDRERVRRSAYARAMNRRITVHLGDITTDAGADAIVNAANPSLLPGGGVCGAIHRAAGPALEAECRTLGGCATGDARITGAGRLAAHHVIHAVGPLWHGGQQGEPQLLASCHRRAIELADANACVRVALPAISTGIFGYPLEQAANTALKATWLALRQHPGVIEARFWLFDQATRDLFADTLGRLERAITSGALLDPDPAVPIPDAD
jgi:O-acetyl-ADP-ribose deacetylase (regulator of RNase III)